MKEKVLHVLQDALPQIDFLASNAMVDEGVIDSLTITEIIATLSMEFDITIPFEEIIEDNFNSIEGLAAMVERLENN